MSVFYPSTPAAPRSRGFNNNHNNKPQINHLTPIPRLDPNLPKSKRYSSKPIHSSPLASSSPPGSSFVPFEDMSTHVESPCSGRNRIAQYKSTPFTRAGTRVWSLDRPKQSTTSSHAPPGAHTTLSSPLDRSTQNFLRERFLTEATQRAARARFRRTKRILPSSGKDDPFMDDDDNDGDSYMEGDEGNVLDDELFGRVMQNMISKENYRYLLSYEQEVGSSFDPSMEDPGVWEEEVNGTIHEEIPPEFLDEDVEPPPEELITTEAEWDALFDELPDEVLLAADVRGDPSPQQRLWTDNTILDVDMDL